MPASNRAQGEASGGKLRIGDDWNAITIIALSQSNPLKALAELVENSIDARAKHVVITRGKSRGAHFLRIEDDGEGVRLDEEGRPDFRYVATHVCDSIKRRMKREGAAGLQGEFGIGLLSFWTMGDELTLSCPGSDGKQHQMIMKRGDPAFSISARKTLVLLRGTKVTIQPLLAGIRGLSGEKMQWYLAAELRDRIRQTGVEVRIVDHVSRAEYKVEPRLFSGRLVHEVESVLGAASELHLELYIASGDPGRTVGLYRHGTRVLDDLAALESFKHAPWNAGYLQGLVDCPFINLTPGTRSGMIFDDAYERLCAELRKVEPALNGLIEAQRRAEEEKISQEMLHSVQKALKEALLSLPAEEYDWFNVHAAARPAAARGAASLEDALEAGAAEGAGEETPRQKQFFEFAGPLFSVKIAPASCVVPVGGSRALRVICRDKTRHLVSEGLQFQWRILEGAGALAEGALDMANFQAGAEPGLVKIGVAVTQGITCCEAEALVTVTASLLETPRPPAADALSRGIPAYTFEHAPGELWRARFDEAQNVVVINSGHRDFLFASRTKALKTRYLVRLFSKELVLRNFVGVPPGEILERLIELSLYCEENLK